MNKQEVSAMISARILNLIGSGYTVEQAMGEVLGGVIYTNMISDLYDDLKNRTCWCGCGSLQHHQREAIDR